MNNIEAEKIDQIRPIEEVGADLGLLPEEIEPYGRLKAKIAYSAKQRVSENKNGKLILVSAMTPTPAGEGKTTTCIGLADSLRMLGRKTALCLREPSMGPVFGIKGGATGGGKSQLVPMEEINLHFTGDIHAITSAHNLLTALIANHINHGNALRIDPKAVPFKRVIDMNERSLRNIVVGLGAGNGVSKETGFDITAASEVMAILCLAADITDLKRRLGEMVVSFDVDGQPVRAKDLKAQGAMAAILKEAIKPNLVQTRYSTPVLVHGGPFANIAHGCNSLMATQMALKLADLVVTEAGFATDLGAEKFFDIKCRYGKLRPDAAVIVATIRALKMHGGVAKSDLKSENLEAVKKGFENLTKHIENIQMFGVPAVVAVNKFHTDTDAEINWVLDQVKKLGFEAVVSDIYANGPKGGIELAEAVEKAIESGKNEFDFLYPLEMPLIEKINVIARCCYGAGSVTILPKAKRQLEKFETLGYRHVPVCIAKTQASLSDNAKLLGRPRDFDVVVREARLSAGAGFVVAIAGEIMTMPGLPKEPAAEIIDIDENGQITGLF
ncbi:MAG: formate--tetrahydrofolate ligase [Clostridiales bacterium]|nr:formate--tetrahydrofolate ligase [Clostridiales bacterium]MDN5281211.1 formate--tetrahydrofolate ligase [Candidatus Ozemobacter sp.]